MYHPFSALKGRKLVIRPLPGLPVVRDLIVDMTQFYENYEKVKPFLIDDELCRQLVKTCSLQTSGLI